MFLCVAEKMEACLGVEREQEKVVKKLKAVSGSATEKLQQVLDQIQALKELLTAAGEDSLSLFLSHVVV